MATEYSLLTCLGLSTAVTLSTSTDAVTLANHGMPVGHAFRFLATSTTLPSIGGVQVSPDTTYYVSASSLAAGTFLISSMADGSDALDITAAGSAVKIVGEYWASRTVDQKARYGTAGSERVYAGMNAADTAIDAMTTDYSKDIVIEVYDAWTDYQGGGVGADFAFKWRSMTVHSKVGTTRTPAYHVGVFGAGYVLQTPSQVTQLLYRGMTFTVDGLEFLGTAASPTTGAAVRAFALNCTVRNCLAYGGYYGIWATAVGAVAHHNVVISAVKGIQHNSSNAADTAQCYNNIVAKCTDGFVNTGGSYTPSWNNIAIGCTNPWSAAPTNCFLGNNASDNGTPWGTSPVTLAADFSDFMDYANNDFRPATASKLQVNSGITLEGVATTDIADHTVPNYQASTYPNNVIDIGAFEFDHGEGLAPQQVTISLTGMVQGSVLGIYKDSDGSEIVAPTTIGASGSHSLTYSYTGDTAITVKVRKGSAAPKYLPYQYSGTITTTGFSLNVSQIPDTIA